MRPLSIVEKDGILILRLDGNPSLDEAHAASLRQLLYSTLESRPEPRVVIDLSTIDYITSTGIALLIGTKRRVEARQGQIALFGLNDEIAHLFDAMKLGQLFNIAENEAQALGLFPPSPSH